jgi:hypothetical protein
MKPIFKPEENLMKQLSSLRKDNAKQWYKEYILYHQGVDQGISYMIGYFKENHRNLLKKAFGL